MEVPKRLRPKLTAEQKLDIYVAAKCALAPYMLAKMGLHIPDELAPEEPLEEEYEQP